MIWYMQQSRRQRTFRPLVAFIAIGALLLAQFVQIHFHVHHVDVETQLHEHHFDLHAELLDSHEHDHAAATKLDPQQANLVKQLLNALSVALLFLLVSLALLATGGGTLITRPERDSPSRPHFQTPPLRAPPAPTC